MRNPKRFFLFCLIGSLLLLLAASCNGGNNGPVETEVVVTEVVVTEVVETEISPTTEPPGEPPTPIEGSRVCDPLPRNLPTAGQRDYQLEEDQRLIHDHLIISGDATDIGFVVEEFSDRGYPLEEMDQYSFEGFGDNIPPMSSNLYRFENGVDLTDLQTLRKVEGIINDIYSDIYSPNRESTNEDNDWAVFIDFNYITGRPVTADPDGDSGGANPDPTGGPGSRTTIDLFRGQWAFEHINLASGGNVNQNGEAEVYVAIFDTSPYDASDEELAMYGISPNMAYNIHWAEPDLELCISEPIPVVNLQYFGGHRASDISDHGLFVAGLVHGVAPQSNIELVRVLDDYGHGDTYTLIKALMLYAVRAISSNGGVQFPLNNTVINLSLGIDVEDDWLLKIDSDLEENLQGLLEATYGISQDQSLRVIPLQLPFHLLHEMGAVIVAASGNDSLRGRHEPMQIPAEYVDVIGVAASNINKDLACFSNMGQVMAPGGDSPPDPPCQRTVRDLCDPPDEPCKFALVSLSHKYPSGYAFWKGTSFATPLVSGMAALMVDSCNGISLGGIAARIPFDRLDTIGVANPPIIDVSGTLTGMSCPP